ncbi:cytochrome b [Methylobacterium segetis]|uniref:cytochrome b n=1 Tax=Methylobacterium segetis TaxID=2488750 RepID=UPI001404492C|nr:cytochrome b [Methylobacterium segetis]
MTARTDIPLPAPLSLPTRLLHWGVALGILVMLAYGLALQWVPSGPARTASVQVHKSLGLLVLALAAARLLWRWREGFPPPGPARGAWERRAARGVHAALIAASLLMPLSGIVRSLAYARPVALFGLPVIPQIFAEKQERLYALAAGLHDGLAWVLAGLVALHGAAALKHHCLDRDGTLRRMLGLGR